MKTENFIAYADFIKQEKVIKKKNKEKFRFLSIQVKLITSFLFIILVIITIMSYLLLKDYKKTIFNVISYTGTTLAEQSSSVLKQNINQKINLDFYINKELNKNKNSKFKYFALSFYKKQGKTSDFKIEYSTLNSELNTKLSTDKVKKYSRIKLSKFYYDPVNKTYLFISPARFGKVLVGFSVITYLESVIYEPYFKAQTRIIIMAFLFIYLGIILTYLIGNRISFPILLLRMSVKKISSILSSMISGEIKLSSDIIKYNDMVKTKDETKILSFEINNMTNIIKSIVPYISTSTFKHARTKDVSMKKKMTFLFTDIRNFTTMCEGMKPNKVVEVLNKYLDLQAQIISKNKGDIDKFVGDEIMASFDGANKEVNACKTGLEIRQAIEDEKSKSKSLLIDLGIGIHSGEVTFGNVGASDRKDFTSIGDTVNLAARLEGANKVYGTKSLVSESVFSKIQSKLVCREIDLIAVKGKSKPIKIYEILDIKKNIKKDLLNLKKEFEAGFKFYKKMKWEKALDSFTSTYNKFNDKTSKVFIDRIKLFIKNPPDKKWDGVFKMTVK